MVKNIKIKTFLFTFLFISIFIILLIIFEISRKEVKLNLRPMFPTNTQQIDLTSKTLDLHYINQNKLYLSTINFNVNNLGITENLIIYDLLSNDCQTISLNLNKRVSSFVIIDNYVYYSTIHYEEGMIKWELYRDSMNFDSPTLLLNGFFNLPFDYPVLIKKLDKIYFISTDDKSKMQNVYEITENGIYNLLKIETYNEKLYDVEKVIIEKENIYYITIDNEKSYLKKFNLKSQKTENLYEINRDKKYIFDFEIINDNILINIIDNEKSYIVNLNTKKEKRFNSVITYMEKYNETDIIFQDLNHNFILIDSKLNVDRIYDKKLNNMLSKFLIYDSKYLILQDSSNELFKLSFEF